MKIYLLKSYVYLDKHLQSYYRILTLNKMPDGPLSNWIVRIKDEKRSPFEDNYSMNNHCYNPCLYAIKKPGDCHLLCLDKIDELFEFLLENDYDIDYKLSKLINNNSRINGNSDIICSIKLI